MEQKKAELIYNFIKNELIAEPFPIYKDISKKIAEIFGVKLPANQISKICSHICRENNIDKPAPIHPVTAKKRELIKDCANADASGITDEEIYISRLKGYSYSTMCRVYFELTGKLLSVKYFSDKFKSYCVRNSIELKRNLTKPQDFLVQIEKFENNNTEHSEFYDKLQNDEKGSSRKKRLKALSTLHDPIRKLKQEDERDER